MTITATFHRRFRKAVTSSGMSVRHLADRSGYTRSYLGRVIRGEQNNPTLLFVFTLAETLGVSVAWLLGLEGITDEVSERNVLEG